METVSPAARSAIAALDAFGVIDRNTAVRLLPSWARRSELTPDDVKAVVAHYPTEGPRTQTGKHRPGTAQ